MSVTEAVSIERNVHMLPQDTNTSTFRFGFLRIALMRAGKYAEFERRFGIRWRWWCATLQPGAGKHAFCYGSTETR